jgi:hypothetical protein
MKPQEKKPTIVLEVWQSEDCETIVGCDDPSDFIHERWAKPVIFVGKTVDYWVYDLNDTYSRSQLLQFCNLHHERKLRTVHVDLRKL